MQGRPALGYIVKTKGDVRIKHPGNAPGAGRKVGPGLLLKRVDIAPGDTLTFGKNSVAKCIFAGKKLTLRSQSEWVAPTKLSDVEAADSFLVRQAQNIESSTPVTFGVWPLSDPHHAVLYVGPDGEFGLVWTTFPDAKTVTLTAWVGDEVVGTETVPAHVTVDGVHNFGLIESKTLGLKLRSRAHESEAVAVKLEIRTDTGESQTTAWWLPPRITDRTKYDVVVSGVFSALADAGTDADDDWFDALNDALLAVEQDVPSLRGYLVFKCWRQHPNAFVTNEAMRRLAELQGQKNLIDIFTRRQDTSK